MNNHHVLSNRPYLLLTAAIDAGDAPGAMFSKSERLHQYVRAFRFYLGFLKKHPDLCAGIVFCENSGFDLSCFLELIPSTCANRVELLSFSPALFSPKKGKTYNEMLSIDMVSLKSVLLPDDAVFLKCTGRYPILNIKRLCSDVCGCHELIDVCCFRLPGLRNRRARYSPIVDTRCLAVRKDFWNRRFANLYKIANDNNNMVFETIAFSVISENSGNGLIRFFSQPPLILGKQGHERHIGKFVVPKWLEPVYLGITWIYHWLTM